MKDENGFFRYVWRFNALVLALAGLGGAILFGFGLWAQFGGQRDFGPVGHFAPVPKSAEQKFTYRLKDTEYGEAGSTLVVGSTHERLLSLMRWNGSPRSYGLAESIVSTGRISAVGAVNLLIVDVDTDASRWMFHGYDRLILTEEDLYTTEPDGSPYTRTNLPPAFGVVLAVVENDTDSDGELTGWDRQALYAYRVGATQPTKFLSADTIISRKQIATDKYLVVYENGKTATAATFPVPEFKLLSEKPLPNVPK